MLAQARARMPEQGRPPALAPRRLQSAPELLLASAQLGPTRLGRVRPVLRRPALRVLPVPLRQALLLRPELPPPVPRRPVPPLGPHHPQGPRRRQPVLLLRPVPL